MAAVLGNGVEGGPMGPLEAALNAQRSFMDRYGDPLEQLLSVLVYMVPVQDEEDQAGYWSQAVYSAIDLFNLYRTVLLRSPEALPVAAPTPRTRQLRLQYTAAAFMLRALRSVQVLLEMRAARRDGLREALRVCLRLEAAKLALKLAMRSRTPFAFYVDEDALEAVEPPGPRAGGGHAAAAQRGGARPAAPPEGAATSARAPEEAFVGRRSGKTLRALGGGGGGGGGGATPPRGAEGTAHAPAVLAAGLPAGASAGTARMAAAEALFHGRPLLHVLLLLRRGRGSWKAWSLALLAEVLSLGLLASEVRHGPGTRAAVLETAELARRRGQLWWALARSPLFDLFFRRWCEFLDRVLRRIPVLNVFNFVELGLALQPFYFSTSAS